MDETARNHEHIADRIDRQHGILTDNALMARSTLWDYTAALRDGRFSLEECVAALNGTAIPTAIGHPLHQLCLVHGIRYHAGYGEELRGVLPVFTRSLNARAIMSNEVPRLEDANDIPYCIWHPDTATEDTYRELLRHYQGRFPQLTYQVGRACAVAGYTQLYEELGLLPDVHIAEEARECGNLAIFNIIMSQPKHYSIMNDYDRCIELDNREVVHLNGDTSVFWMLNVKQGIGRPSDGHLSDTTGLLVFDSPGFEEMVFNVTEDMSIAAKETDSADARLSPDRLEVQLLSQPLPVDLPTVQKDLLIAMAAYNGDVDRYARLKRPVDVQNEKYCRVRGVLHNTSYALWWASQAGDKPWGIQEAINARMIMNNVLSGTPYPWEETPYIIWSPDIAAETTYRYLAKVQPKMLPQVLHACIVARYSDLFDELLPHIVPNDAHLSAAKEQADVHFTRALHERLSILNAPPDRPPYGFVERWKTDYKSSSNTVYKDLDNAMIDTSAGWVAMGYWCDASGINLNLSLPETWRILKDDPTGYDRDLDYIDWPQDPPRPQPEP